MTLTTPLQVRLSNDRGSYTVTRDARDLMIRNVAPGGYASATVPLDRPLQLLPDDIAYYGRMTVIDCRNSEIVWDGRLEDPSRSASSRGEVWELVGIGAAGHAADRRLPLIYVDQRTDALEPSASQPPTWLRTERQTDDSDEEPYVRYNLRKDASVPIGTRNVWVYRAIHDSGMKLARVAWRRDMGVTDAALRVNLLARTGTGGANDIANIAWNTAAGTTTISLGSGITNGRTVLIVQHERITSALAVGNDNYWAIGKPISIRSLLLNASGTEIVSGYTTNTVLASEVVADLLGRLLSQYDGVGASIATTAYGIDQLAYPDGVTARQVLDDLMLLEPAYYWAAWERNSTGRHRFEWTSWPTEIRYDADILDGYTSSGSADGLYNRVSVRWMANRGQRITRRTSAVPLLDDAGLIREETIDLSDEIGSSANAVRAGDEWLAQRTQPPNAGRLTIARPIFDRTAGRMVMPWEIKAGNLIRVRGILPRVDALNAEVADGVTVFRIVAAEYRANAGTVQLELDSYPRSTAHALAALQRRPVTRRR